MAIIDDVIRDCVPYLALGLRVCPLGVSGLRRPWRAWSVLVDQTGSSQGRMEEQRWMPFFSTLDGRVGSCG